MDIHKSNKNKVIGGVCGGLAEAMGISPLLLRIITVFLVPFAGISVVVYLALCLILPSADAKDEGHYNFKTHSSAGEYCRHCGKQLPPNANVCPYCGKTR